jgi:hypothetical protein
MYVARKAASGKVLTIRSHTWQAMGAKELSASQHDD